MEKSLSKITICLYVIIVLLAINTLVLIVSNGSVESSSDNTTNNTEGSDSTDSAENTEYDVSMFDEITADDLEEVANSDTPQVVYIGRSTCGYCIQFLPSLQKAQSEYGYKTKYLDSTTINSDEQKEKVLAFDNDDKILEENYGATPQVLILKDGKLVNANIGYLEYDAFASFLEENGISK